MKCSLKVINQRIEQINYVCLMVRRSYMTRWYKFMQSVSFEKQASDITNLPSNQAPKLSEKINRGL